MKTYVPADSDNPNEDDDEKPAEPARTKDPPPDVCPTQERGGWSNQLDFLFSCISVSVGLGNVWRFPYLCYRNGGGTFLVTYHIAMLICGVPMFLQEVAIGQYLGSGGMTLVGTLCPILRGAGYASMTIVFLLDVYYCVIVAWTIFYLGGSISSLWTHTVPWESCGNWWNSDMCGVSNHTGVTNIGAGSPAEEYWSRRVLQATKDIEHFGSMRWELLVCLAIAWLVVFGVLRKGLHASGKVVWFTALFPCFMLTVLLVRAVTLRGAGNGLRALFAADWEGLLRPQAWIDGATQIFFGYSIGVGTLPALGSYNNFYHNCYRDAIITCIVNTLTSLVAAVITFSSLGFLADSQGVEVSQVVSSGPGLVFVTYPEVLLQLPGAPIWAVIFFFMLLILGVDSEFCNVESFITGVLDKWPSLQNHRMVFGLSVCSLMCALAFPMLSQGGLYIFQLMDNYAASGMPLLWVAFFQTAAISWAFGTERFSDCVEKMTGVRPGVFWRLCWGIVAPSSMAGIFIFYAVGYRPTTPAWAEIVGLSISAVSMMWIPLCAIHYIFTKEGTFMEVLRRGVTPLDKPNPRRRRQTLLLESPGALPLCESKVTLV